MSKKVTRLYKQFAPKSYQLQLKISENKLKFSGRVVIEGHRKGRPSSRITLHQKNLSIKSVALHHSDKKGIKKSVEISRIVSHKAYDELRLHTTELVYAGNYHIEIEFEGNITNNMDGIYPSVFMLKGVERRLIATQFESHHAREAFPCIDEPEAKATFQLSLTHPSSETALSNTPVERVENLIDGVRTTYFEPTPIMSSYLLAFVVGELSYSEKISKNGVHIRTYATPEQAQNTEFSLEVAVKCMDFYEDYYGIPYPLAKCDFVALPDFASGAMENWGLITFREHTLLCDENTSLGTRQYVALVIAHELTHQWFGNLVTMRWWTDLWLNEGFASWMEYLAVDEIFPEWQIWKQFTVDEQQLALKLDALEYTHPVEVAIGHPDEIRTIFDSISYQKGASVIHMLYHYLGADDFRSGLSFYLKKHAYSNTDTVDLWDALEEISGKPIRDFMNDWTKKDGFPLLTVKEQNDHLKITQQRFVANPLAVTARLSKTIWQTPLLADDLAADILGSQQANIVLKSKDLTKINIGQRGFYRVDYSHDIQKKQILAMRQGKIDEIDRMGLLADCFEVTRAGYQSVSEYLHLLQHYSDEDSLATWDIIATSIGTIRANLSSYDLDNELRDLMKPFVLKIIKKQFERLGWDKTNEPHNDTLLRPTILSLAASSDDPDVLKRSIDLFIDAAAGRIIDPDLRSLAYVTAARKGSPETFDQMLTMYKAASSSDEKLSLCSGMTMFEQPEIHSKVLELIKTDTIRNQDISYWIAYSLSNRFSRDLAWYWVRDNWKWLKDNIGTDLSFARTPIYVARNFADQTKCDEYKAFFKSVMEPSIERSYNQGLEIIETATAWRDRDSKVATEWFRSNYSRLTFNKPQLK